MFPRFTHVVAGVTASFLFVAEKHPTACISHLSFLHCLLVGAPPFGCCGHWLTLPGESPLQVLGWMQTSGITGSCGHSAFDLSAAAPLHVPTGRAHGLCLHSLAALATICLSYSAHPRIAKWELMRTVLACISPLPSKAKLRCTSLLAMGATSLETWLLGSCAQF